MIGGISSSISSLYAPPTSPTTAGNGVGGIDSDGDRDGGTESRESASTQASESSKSLSLPSDPNRGRLVNIAA